MYPTLRRTKRRQTDPYWTTARYKSKCRGCGAEIQKGDRFFYYPAQQQAYCAGDNCGKKGAYDLARERSMAQFGTDCAYDY